MIAAEVLTRRDEIESVFPEWQALIKGSTDEVFSCPAWYEAYRIAENVRGIAVICARQDGRLVGILPLSRSRSDYTGLFLPITAPFSRADYQPPIILSGMEAVVLPILLDRAFQHFGKSGTFWWPFMPEDSPSLPVLRSYFLDRRMPTFEAKEIAPRLRIHGLSFAELEKNLTSNHRKDVRRQRKRLAELGPVSLWQPPTLEEAESVLTEFFGVHDEKWLAQGYPGKFQNPTARKHFQEMLRQLWGQGAYFTVVRCGEVNVSYHFGFLSGGWVLWYRPTYRSEYFGYSPGKIHVAMLLEEACQNQWEGFDFLLGGEPYKYQWSNETRRVVSIWAGSSERAPSYWWFASAKPYLKKRFLGHLMRARTWIQKFRGTSSE